MSKTIRIAAAAVAFCFIALGWEFIWSSPSWPAWPERFCRFVTILALGMIAIVDYGARRRVPCPVQ